MQNSCALDFAQLYYQAKEKHLNNNTKLCPYSCKDYILFMVFFLVIYLMRLFSVENRVLVLQIFSILH